MSVTAEDLKARIAIARQREQLKQRISQQPVAAKPPIQEQPKVDAGQEVQSIDDMLRERAQQISPFEAGLIAAGRGITTIGRGLGIADPESEIGKQAFQALEEESPIATTIGEIAGESAPFLVPGVGIAGATGRVAQVCGTTAVGASEAGLITRG